MTVTCSYLSRPLDAAGMVGLGLVVGVGLSSLGLVWPWVASVGLAAIGLRSRQRNALLLWAALGIASGALIYIILALSLSQFGEPSSGGGGS
jgi:hypothetical protein